MPFAFHKIYFYSTFTAVHCTVFRIKTKVAERLYKEKKAGKGRKRKLIKQLLANASKHCL